MKKPKVEIPAELQVTHIDLADRIVLVRNYSDPLMLFHCMGGFGCSPIAMGQKIGGRWLSDHTEDAIRRGDVVRLATEEEIASAQEFAKRPAKDRWLAQLRCYLERQDEHFETVRTAGLKMSKSDLQDQYSTLAYSYGRLQRLIEKHLDLIAELETKMEPNGRAERPIE